MDEPTREGEKKIERWQRAIERLRSAKDQVNRAECELTNATNDLGRWLMPDDARIGEPIGVWYGDALITATKTRDGGRGLRKRLGRSRYWS